MSAAPRGTRPARLLASAAVGLAALVPGRAANATDYTVTVDVSKQVGNPRFWSAAVGTGTASLTLRSDLQTQYKIANRELGMLRVRGHGVLNDDMGIFKWSGGTAAPTYNWTNFDKYLAAIVAAGMRPLMELSFMPTSLSSDGTSRSKPKDLNVYKQFIQAVVQHCVDKYGAADVGQWYWEVWNEPDYPGFWNNTMDDYYALYDAAVDGATAVLPNILIGGPVTTEPSKIGPFLQHCKSANKRVTFASSHAYPGGDGTNKVDPVYLVNDNNTRVTQIGNGGYSTSTVHSINTEYNSAYAGQGGNAGDANESMDSHVNAPFIIKSVRLLADKNQGDTPALDVFSYWVVSDVFDESSGPSGSYILSKGGNLPFGEVFGLMTFQGVRKAAFNGFKMLNYLGPKRVSSGGGTGAADGVDSIAAMSASGDEVQILVYNYYATVKTSGTDNVTVNVSNLPASLAGKQAYVTHFRVDDSHSNPYGIWLSQGKPTNPTEAQWQAMRAAQHLALLQPVSKMQLGNTYTTSFALPKQAASLIIVGLNRPVTGRNAFVEIEGEDYDGQSGITKEDSNDTSLGQSVTGNAGAYEYFENVDLSDAGVGAVQLRVAAQSNTTLELHADTQTGPLLGSCAIASTSGSWATDICMLTPTSGVHKLYATFGGAMRLNWMKFQAAGSDGGVATGGTSATGGTTGAADGSGNGNATGSDGDAGITSASGGSGTDNGGSTSGGNVASSDSATGGGASTDVGNGSNGASGASGVSGASSSSAGVASGGDNSNANGSSGTSSGESPPAPSEKSGCSVSSAGAPSGISLLLGLLPAALVLRRRRPRRAA